MSLLANLFLVVGTVVVLLYGAADTVHAAAASGKKVTLAYSSLGSLQTAMWMAKETKVYEKYGLDADLIYISSGPTVIQALLGNDLQGGLAATNALIAAAGRGAPLVGVLTTSNVPYHKLYVQPDIKRIEDLRGKTLGVTRFGSLSDNLTRIYLRKYGLENSVTVRQMGGVREVFAAFEQRTIQGAVQGELRVAANVPYHVLARLEEMGIKLSMDVLAVSREYLQRNPQTVDGMIRAYVEGVSVLNNQKDLARRIISKYVRMTDSSQIDAFYQNAIAYTARAPRIDLEAVQNHPEFSGQKNLKFEQVADNSTIDRLIQEGFVDRLYKKP
jgi:NitT/TauT family transport system substrate-binding protein